MKIKNKYLIVFLVTIVVRLLVAVLFINIFPEWPTGSSKNFRIYLANSIASGNGFSYNGIPNLYQTPVYPFFLAGIFVTFGNHWWSIALFQGILEGVSSIGISKIGNRFSKYGWLSGLIYAFYPYSAMQSRSIVDTPIFVFVFVMTIFCLIKFAENNHFYYLLLSSIFLGIGILNRPSIVIIMPAFFLYLISKKLYWKKIFRYSLIFLIITGIIPFSWIMRNYSLTNKFPILTVGGSHFMWYAHNKYTYKVLKQDESADIIGIDPRYPMDPNIRVSDFFGIMPKDQVELSKQCKNEVKNWIINNKSEVIRYSILKVKKFLDWEYDIKDRENPLQNLRLYIYRYTNAPITIFGWIGLILLIFKRKEIAIFFIAVAIGFIFIHVITNFSSRHKIPLDALFISVIPFTFHFLYQKILFLQKKIGKA